MRALLASLMVLALALPASAAFEGPDEKSAADSVNTAARALRAPDDAPCVLEGRIMARLPKEEHYRFQDASGSIPVEIDDELFAGQKVTPDSKVRLRGEVDVNDHGDREIEVKALEILE